MKCFQVFHLFNQSQGRENLWTFCASETCHFNNHFESFFFIYYYFGDIFIKLAERSILFIIDLVSVFFSSFFSSALQTPLGSAGQPPPPSIKIFPSVWRVEAPSQRRIVVRSWRTPILCLCANKIKNNAPDVSSAPLTAGGGGGEAPHWQRPSESEERKSATIIIGSKGPAPLPMLISPSSEVEEHLNPTLLNSYCKLQTTTTTTPEILGTRWLAKENGIICV